jgi:hypothetical protein
MHSNSPHAARLQATFEFGVAANDSNGPSMTDEEWAQGERA